MKHYSANLEQSVTVTDGDLTITANDSLIIDNATLSGAGRAIQLLGANTQIIDGTGAIVANTSIETVGVLGAALGTGAAMTNVVHFEGQDNVIQSLDLNALAGANTNTVAGTLPVAAAADGTFTGTPTQFLNSALIQTAPGGTGALTAGGTFRSTGDLTADAGLTVAGATALNGTIGLGNEAADTITAASLAGAAQGVVLTSAAGVLSRAGTIPQELLPNIAIGDVFVFSTNTDTKAAAEAEFYAATPGVADGNGNTISPTQPYHRGDIAIITYDADGSDEGPGTAVLIYVGANQTAVGPSAASDWHDISLSAQGVVDINTTTADQLTITDGATTVLDIVTAPVADTVMGLATGDQIHTFVTSQPLSITGDVATVVGTGNVSLSGDGSLRSFAVELQPDVVDLPEINAVQDATPANDAGKVLTINSAGTGLEWGVNGVGTVGKVVHVESTAAASSGAIDISSLNTGKTGDNVDSITVTVWETEGGNLSMIIPDTVVFDTANDTVTVTYGTSITGRVVITG